MVRATSGAMEQGKNLISKAHSPADVQSYTQVHIQQYVFEYTETLAIYIFKSITLNPKHDMHISTYRHRECACSLVAACATHDVFPTGQLS